MLGGLHVRKIVAIVITKHGHRGGGLGNVVFRHRSDGVDVVAQSGEFLGILRNKRGGGIDGGNGLGGECEHLGVE